MTRFPRIKQKWACGPCAVRFLIKHFEGIDVPEKELVVDLATNVDGFTTLPRNIIKYLRGRGYTARPRRGMRGLMAVLKCPWMSSYGVGLIKTKTARSTIHTGSL